MTYEAEKTNGNLAPGVNIEEPLENRRHSSDTESHTLRKKH